MLALYMALVETETGRVLFETIFNEYQQRMFYIANQVLGDASLAEDAVQDALIAIAKTVDKVHFEDEKEIKSYVYTTAKRAAYDIQKKEAKKSDAFDRFQASARPFDPDAFNPVANKEILLQVLAIIEKMPPLYREVLFYASVYEMNSTLMGELLGRPAATVRKQLIRARTMLASLCEKEGIHFGD